MTSIFFYELKRLLWNLFFVGILTVILFTGWQILNQVTLLGIEQTAPFSVQSFCDYLLRLLPLLWIGTLFFLSFFFSKSEQKTAVITHATPVNPLVYAAIRCSAAFIGSLLLIAAVFLLAAVFYGRFFHWYHWETLLLPGCLILIPMVLIDILIGWFIGQKFPWFLLIWMLIPVFIIIVIL